MNNLLLNIFVQTNSKKNKISRIINNRIKIFITALPIKNKANKLLISFIAKKFKVNKNDIIIKHGKKSYNKTLIINNPKIIPIEIKNILHLLK